MGDALRIEDVLIPLDVLRQRFGISESTAYRWLRADSIDLVRYGDGFKAVRWGDIETAQANTTRRWTETSTSGGG